MYHKSAIAPLRKMSRLVSEDFIHWKNDELVLEPDELDQPDTEFYGLSPFPYGNQYLGFLWVFHGYQQQIDVQLVSSRDGRRWDRSAHRRVFLPLGFMKNDYNGRAFDSEMIMAIAPAVATHGKLWMYYTGYSNKHNSNTDKVTLDDSYLGQIGVATLGIDGFCSLDATSEGYVVTRPIHLKGSAVHITASTRWFGDQGQTLNPTVWAHLYTNVKDGEGEVRVELQDEQGRTIPGYSAEECNPIKGDLADRAASWSGGKDLSALEGRSVRFKFVLRNASLFSYSLQ